MNKLSRSLIEYIFEFASIQENITAVRICKNVYQTIKNTEKYQFEHLKREMREIIHTELIKTKSDDLDIVVPNGLISEAYFYIVYVNTTNDEFITKFISSNTQYFDELIKKYDWSHMYDKHEPVQRTVPFCESAPRYKPEDFVFTPWDEILVDKRMTIPIRKHKRELKNIGTIFVVKLPLYCYCYTSSRRESNYYVSIHPALSMNQKDAAFCRFIIERNELDKYKKTVVKLLKNIENRENTYVDVHSISMIRYPKSFDK